MLPYIYIYDNVQHYVEHLIAEYYDDITAKEKLAFVNDIMNHHRVRPLLKEVAENLLDVIVNNDTLITAILNSCDWNELYEHIKSHIENY